MVDMAKLTLRQLLGQKLIFGFHGTALSSEAAALLREYQVGNVILFLRNVESAEQVRLLCSQIRALVMEETGIPPFIVIDQEGGMVSRLPADAVNVPGAMALAATGDPENAAECARITVRQLRGLGANFNMAPVLDVNSNPQNPVIGVRSFGDEAEIAAQFGEAAVRAYAGSGVLCCGKHFPGHGDTAVDSHLGLPMVDKTVDELERLELIPFRRAIAAGLPAVMVGHMLFPRITDEGVPGTMSRRIVTGLLKERLGFRGLVLTDCMEMGAIQQSYGTARGVVAAIRAGVDLAELSGDRELQRQSAKGLLEAAESGGLDLNEVRVSVEKILKYKSQLADCPEAPLCNREEDRRAAERLAAMAVTLYDGTPLCPDGDTFFCGCADYRVSGVGNESGDVDTFPAYMASRFGGGSLVTGKDPGPEEIRAAAARAAGYGQIVLGTCNAHLFRGQLALAKALAGTGRPLTIAVLRNPYDLPLLPHCRCRAATYDYSLPALRALGDVLEGAAPLGRLPVKL